MTENAFYSYSKLKFYFIMNNLVLEVIFVVVLATHHGIYCYNTVTDKVQSMYTTDELDHMVRFLSHGPRNKRSVALISNLIKGLRQGDDYVTGVMQRYQDIQDNIPRYIANPVYGRISRRQKNRMVRRRKNLIINIPTLDILMPGLRNLVRPFIPKISSRIDTPVNIMENDYPSYNVNIEPEEIIQNKYIDPTILSSLKYLLTDAIKRRLIPIIKSALNPRLNEKVNNIKQIVENINDILYKVLYQNVLKNSNDFPKIQDVPSIITETPMNPGVIWDNIYSNGPNNKLRYEQRRHWLLEQFNRITNPYVRDIVMRQDIIDNILSRLEEHTNYNTHDQRAEVDVLFFDSPLAYNNYIGLEFLNNNQAPEFPQNGNIILIVVKFDGDVRGRLWLRNIQTTDVISQVHDVKVPENDVLIPPDTQTYQEQSPIGIDDFAYRIIGGKPATGSGSPIQSKGKRSISYVVDDDVEENSEPEDGGDNENDSEENE